MAKSEFYEARRERYRTATREERESAIHGCIVMKVSKEDCPAVFDDEDRTFYDAMVRSLDEIAAKGGVAGSGEEPWWREDQ